MSTEAMIDKKVEALARRFAKHDGYGQIEWRSFDLDERAAYRAYAKIAVKFLSDENPS